MSATGVTPRSAAESQAAEQPGAASRRANALAGAHQAEVNALAPDEARINAECGGCAVVVSRVGDVCGATVTRLADLAAARRCAEHQQDSSDARPPHDWTVAPPQGSRFLGDAGHESVPLHRVGAVQG
jgi:hypothetical protein